MNCGATRESGDCGARRDRSCSSGHGARRDPRRGRTGARAASRRAVTRGYAPASRSCSAVLATRSHASTHVSTKRSSSMPSGGPLKVTLLRGIGEQRSERDRDDRVGVVVGEPALGDLLLEPPRPHAVATVDDLGASKFAHGSSRTSSPRWSATINGIWRSCTCEHRAGEQRQLAAQVGGERAASRSAPMRSSSSACAVIAACGSRRGPCRILVTWAADRPDNTSATLARAFGVPEDCPWVMPSSSRRRGLRSGPRARARWSM